MLRVVTLVSWVALAVGLLAGPAAAQPHEPLGGAVVDLRAVTVSLPTTIGWAPTVRSSGALVPGRGLGVDAGVHIFAGPGRFRRFSVGASGLVAEGRATGPDTPTIASRIFAVAPHAALNFGHRDGWSYLSGGLGMASVRATEGGVADAPATWGLAFHYGGGARWFLREHLALSLGLRFWALTPRPATTTRPSGSATTHVAFAAGLAFR